MRNKQNRDVNIHVPHLRLETPYLSTIANIDVDTSFFPA